MTYLGGGWLFIIIDVIAVVVLAAAMLYGNALARRAPRDPATRRAQEEATRKLYHPRDRDTGRPRA
jgi:hypothetical protein